MRPVIVGGPTLRAPDEVFVEPMRAWLMRHGMRQRRYGAVARSFVINMHVADNEVFLAVTSTAAVSIRSCPRPPASEHPAQSRCYTYVTSLMTWLAGSVVVAMTPVLSYIQYTGV